MALDTSGFLLEGVRLATANNPFTFPPRTLITDSGALNARSGRAEYCLFVHGQASGRTGVDVADPELRFRWVRNNGRTSRFDFDAFSRRWASMPGGPPEALGKLSNFPRLIAAAPDSAAPESPYSLYVGSPVRRRSFSLVEVATSASFGSPASGIVEVSKDKGELNFGPADLADALVAGQTVYFTRQGFFDRIKTKGRIGVLPESSATGYHLFLNPIPGSGQTPLIRIGYGPYLSVATVSTEAGLSTLPATGTCKVSLDTGRLIFSASDLSTGLGEAIYYDGIYMGELQFVRGTVGPIVPSSSSGVVPALVGLADSSRFAFYFEPVGAPAGTPRYYLQVELQNSSQAALTTPNTGTVVVDVATGDVYGSSGDAIIAGSAFLKYVDCLLYVEGGVSIQLYRSGVNGVGYPTSPDFVESYAVSGQVLDDSLKKSPFVMLMVTPIVDSSLRVEIDQGPGGGGTFTGELADASDPLRPGLGYLLDLDSRQLKLSDRKTSTVVLPKPAPTVKLPDAAIFGFGLEVKRNGIPIEPGLDFDFNAGAGIVEFVGPVGENDARNKLGVSGAFTTPNLFTASTETFTSADRGLFLFSSSPGNFGFHEILAVENTKSVFVRDVSVSGSETVDVRADYEIIVDRFWGPFTHPLRKVKVERLAGVGGISTTLLDSEYSILATTSQINLAKASGPGDVFRVTYTSLDSPDEGVTVTPVTQTEYAAFKVRQEQCTVNQTLSYATFNPEGKTVDTGRTISVSVDGVSQDSTSFRFEAPGTIYFGSRLTTQSVIVDYWVLEAPGGNQVFNLLKSPMDVDLPTIVGLDTSDNPVSVFNGDKRAELLVGGAILADAKTVLIVETVSYDSASDTTSVTFNPDPAVTLAGVPLQACDTVTGSYLVLETLPTDTVPKGTSVLTVHGASDYRAGSIVILDGDPYLATSVKVDDSTGDTIITFGESVRRNYILPSIQRTVRPVLQPGVSFQTLQQAHVGYPFTLIRGGVRPLVLSGDLDYSFSEGGAVTTATPHGRDDTLSALYVARITQPAGTQVEANYSYAIAPSQANGIEGQKLVLSYSLRSPDTFYFRVESVESFLPEVQADLKSSASSGSSGPSIQSRSSLQSKDMGSASLYFDEQHYSNFDVVMSRLLKYYNDLANYAEDILSGMDGRVVGGTDGRFRFDALTTNPPRASFAEITNDVDDRVKLYDGFSLTGFFTFAFAPVYGPMYEPNSLSRIYPTVAKLAAAINDKVTFADFGKIIGTFPVTKITSVGAVTAAASSAAFLATSDTTATIQQNGDPKNLIPPFAAGQKVIVYTPLGAVVGPNKILSVLGTGPYELTFDDPIGVDQGGVALDVVGLDPPKFYTNGKDLIVDAETGQIKNFRFPPPLDASQVQLDGNEIIESVLAFNNSSIPPRRMPVLDGSVLTDSGRPSIPPLSRVNELGLLQREAAGLLGYGTAKVATGGFSVTNVTGAFAVGNKARFLSGPNAGTVFVVFSVSSPSSFTLDILGSPLIADSVSRELVVYASTAFDPTTIPAQLINVIDTSSFGAPASGDLIGPINSELKSMDVLARHMGPQQASGTGIISSSAGTLTDSSADLSASLPGWLLLVTSGSSAGLYKVVSSTLHSVTISTDSPFASFPSSGSASYVLIKPWSFLPSGLAGTLSDLMRSTRVFLSSTVAWSGSMSSTGASSRLAVVNARITDLDRLVKLLESQLGKQGKLYDARYLWLKQRVDKKDGTLAKRVQSEKKRVDNTQKLLDDQEKLLIASGLA